MLASRLHSISRNLRFHKFNANKCYIKSYSTKLQYISDIHLEYRTKMDTIQPIGEHLALLGDIGNPYKQNYIEFLRYCSSNWNKVFLLSGNHEYWQENNDYTDVDIRIRDIVTMFDNVFFLNNDKYELGNYTILGTTLWSRINKEPTHKMGDDLYIKSSSVPIQFEELNGLFENSKKWLEDNIGKSKKQVIVLTHHLPTYRLIIDRYKTPFYAKYQDRFASNLDYLINDPVKYWLCGHSHSNNEIKINGIMCGINAYGYQRESDLKPQEQYLKCVELE